MFEWLNGVKTYLGLIAAGLVGVAMFQGWITEDTAGTLWAVIGAWTGVAVKHAWDKRAEIKK